MRKILSLLLCVLMCCFLLASCAEEEIGADLKGYLEKYTPEKREDIVLDFYIITGDGTNKHAIDTVSREINAYLESKYQTTLDIHFITEAEYNATVIADAAAEGEARADIVFVNGIDMFNTLRQSGSLVSLNDHFISKDFGRLNSSDMIATALLQASTVIDGEGEDAVVNRYVVPNNRPVGSYNYIMVHRAMAQFLNYSTEGEGNSVSQMTSADAPLYIALKSDLVTYDAELRAAGFDPDKCIIHLNGASYLDRNSLGDEYECVISATPVITAEEAHEASFAVIKQDGKDESVNNHQYYRCMEIIYCLNTDATLRNLLLYGVENTHYSVDDNGVVSKIDTENVYEMSILHTGNFFTASYNDFAGSESWTQALSDAGKLQNKESVRAD
ncbi:MAG: hypothetical protein IKC87_06340 [Clostridia bacterium]|nr:hypothetical protein [Clostridia bacterium]